MSTTPHVKSAQAIFDEQIAQCEARIAQYTGKIAALAGNPDAGPAREMMAKVLESERNFRVSLETQRDAARQPRKGRFRSPAVTWPLALLAVAVLAAMILLHLHVPH